MSKPPDVYLDKKQHVHYTDTCQNDVLFLSWQPRLYLCRCRIRHQRKRPERIIPPTCPALNPASPHRLPGHDIYSFTCMSEEERPGSDCCSVHRPCPRACSLGSARFGSVCPSRQLARIMLCPSFCTVTSERINDAQSAFTNSADADGADTNRQLCTDVSGASPHPLHHRQPAKCSRGSARLLHHALS